MQGQRETRRELVLIVFVAVIGASLPCSSNEPAHAEEFFAIGDSQWVDASEPLFGMNDAVEVVEDNLFVLFVRASATAPPTLESSTRATSSYRGRNPFGSRNETFFKTMGVGMFVAAAGDFATTEISLQTPGIVEMNPVQRNLGLRLLTHAAAPAFVYWITERARRKGNGKLALLIRVGFNVAFSYAAMYNARTLAVHR